MAGDKDNGKKGFSGLSDLASEVSGIDEPIKPELKPEAKPSAPKQPPQPQQESVSSESEGKTTSFAPPIETVSSGKSGGGSGDKWILGIIVVAFVIWLIYNIGPSNKKPSFNSPSSSQNSSYPQSNSAPEAQIPSATRTAQLRYIKPSVGTNNVLSVPEIRWCIREGIRIEAMRDIIDTNEGIDKFNQIVDDYNGRCESYRYLQGHKTRAERDVEPFRSQIVKEAIQEARQVGRSYQSSYPSVSPGASTSSASKKTIAQYTRDAQQILTDLGYDPGPIDGQCGPRTMAAVKQFQKEAGLAEDGIINEELVEKLQVEILRRHVKNDYHTTRQSIKEQPLPSSGTIKRFTVSQPLAPFKISASQGDNYLLKLVNYTNDDTILTVFIRSGSTIEIDVPLGTYEVRYACGKTWYGYKNLFGPNTDYSKADRLLNFKMVGNQFRGFNLTLYKVRDGNLVTSKIDASEF